MDAKNNGSWDDLMREAIELARSGYRRVSPNPRTGALVLRNGEIIGRGRHEIYGGPHAEVNAIRDAGPDLSGCELVVTLEPCCHTGKTPPCTDLIISSGIKRVVIGMTDPNPAVAGKGIRLLREAGIDVIENVQVEAGEAINQPFIKMMSSGMPYVIAKSAITLDGFIADEQGRSKWISSDVSRREVHKMRAQADAVLVGVGTALADDPELTVRDAEGENPLRVIYDPDGILPVTLKMIRTAKEIPTCIITGPHSTPVWRDQISAKGVRLLETEHIGILGLKEGLLKLGKQGVQSILAEGGGKLQSLLAELDCVDRLDLFIAPKLVGKGIRMMLVPPREMEQAMIFPATEWHRSGPDAHFTGILHQYYTRDDHKHPEKE